jgi:hypothetical protein
MEFLSLKQVAKAGIDRFDLSRRDNLRPNALWAHLVISGFDIFVRSCALVVGDVADRIVGHAKGARDDFRRHATLSEGVDGDPLSGGELALARRPHLKAGKRVFVQKGHFYPHE